MSDRQTIALKERFDADISKSLEILRPIVSIRKIWLFGSVAKQKKVSTHSDLDLAVEGLPSGEEWGLWSVLDESLTSPVDLVRFEDAPPVLQSEILKGEVIYEA